MNLSVPYGDGKACFSLPDSCYAGTIDPVFTPADEDPAQIISRALDNPIGTERLEKIVKPGKKIAIIVDDISRPTPVSLILPVVLQRIEACGVPKSDVRIVIALGSHRYMTEDEIRTRVGDSVYENYRCINSEFRKPDQLVQAGLNEEGVPLMATRSVMEVDTRIGIGNLVPHPVMGWGGGGKIFYPGIAGEDTVSYFHLKASLYDMNMFGLTTTPIRDMMETWVDSIGLDFIINTVMNQHLQLVAAVAGHYVKAHRAGVAIARKVLGVKVPEKTDVVIVSSHPADQDFWQSPKAMYGAEPSLKGESGGTIILVSPNYEGVGPHAEYPLFMGMDNGDELVRRCILGEDVPGDRLAIAVGNSMSKMRRRRRLVVVGDGVTKEEMESCGCIHYPLSQLQKAIDDAIAMYPDCRVSVISNGAETFLYD